MTCRSCLFSTKEGYSHVESAYYYRSVRLLLTRVSCKIRRTQVKLAWEPAIIILVGDRRHLFTQWVCSQDENYDLITRQTRVYEYGRIA